MKRLGQLQNVVLPTEEKNERPIPQNRTERLRSKFVFEVDEIEQGLSAWPITQGTNVEGFESDKDDYNFAWDNGKRQSSSCVFAS